jgi:hypothetical protein
MSLCKRAILCSFLALLVLTHTVFAQHPTSLPGVGSPRDIGDVNGDGHQDFAVTGSQIFVYFGPLTGEATPALTLDLLGPGRVSTIGDVNRDGYADFAVGFPFSPAGGEVRIYWGSAAGPTALTYTRMPAPEQFSGFGLAVAVCNLAGDQAFEIVVGAPDADGGKGEIWTYQITEGGTPATNPSRMIIDESAAEFGTAVSCGDIDGDDYGDLAVSAPLSNTSTNFGGAVFVYRGSVTGLLAPQVLTMEGAAGGAALGRMLSLAGDINGDGRRDLVVLAQRQLRAFSQREGTSSLTQFHSYEVTASEVLLELTSSGDSNGDRFADLVFSISGQAGQQRHVRVHGQALGLATRARDEQAALGARGCALVGDITGDGIGDLLLSDEASGQLTTRIVAGPASYVFEGGFESDRPSQSLKE